jgi:hypothetical protein
MEGSNRRRQTAVSLYRQFTGSRLEEQILKRAFELVLPVYHLERGEDEQPKAEANSTPGHSRQSQGA